MSTRVQRDCLSPLKTLISVHCQVYLKDNVKRLTAKFDFLLHYPDMIVRYGPLVAIWSLRFEAA